MCLGFVAFDCSLLRLFVAYGVRRLFVLGLRCVIICGACGSGCLWFISFMLRVFIVRVFGFHCVWCVCVVYCV